MGTDNNIWRTLKKKGTVTIPTKSTKNTAKTTATAITATTTAKSKPVKVKPPKVKPHKVQHHQAQPQQQAMQPQLSDYRLATTGDSTGVHITVLYRDSPVHQFSLLRTDYATWQRLDSQGKYAYVRIRTNANAFNNDMNNINAVINGTINVLNTLFAQARQAQAHRNMI
jgi:hypothetical protein